MTKGLKFHMNALEDTNLIKKNTFHLLYKDDYFDDLIIFKNLNDELLMIMHD